MPELYRLELPFLPEYLTYRTLTGQPVDLLIRELAEIPATGPWGGPVLANVMTLLFDANKLDAVQAAVAALPGEMLARVQAVRLQELAELRWEKTQTFTYDGVVTQADPAIAVVTGKLFLRDLLGVPPEAQDRWKLGQNQFRLWDRGAIITFGAAIGQHIQLCFDRENALTTEIMGAAGVQAAADIDITTGWPE